VSEIKLRYKKRDVTSFAELLERYPTAELRSPLRSTVPLLAFWHNPNAGLQRLSNVLGVTFRDPVKLVFEHQVSVRKGKGKASHTDLMVLSAGQTLAIEAKCTEPAYATVSKWRKDSDNRTEVLEGWIELINVALKTSLTLESVADCTYQLIHRTASACVGPAATRIVAYQCFDCDARHRDAYIGQLRRLASLLGSEDKLRFVFLECRLQRTAEYERLVAEWNNTARDLESPVRSGLSDGTLLQIQSCSATVLS
jgi:hypothetical protein